MGRKQIDFKATFGRDKGKTFRITELSAVSAHDWATRVLFAMFNAGIELDEDMLGRGMAALASLALTTIGKIPVGLGKPLMDELLTSVEIVFPNATRKLIDDDFEEVATIFQLQRAVFMLHVEPFTSGDPLTSESNPTAP